MDEKEVIMAVKFILKNIGEDPNRLGLRDTPTRVMKMYKEIFRGYDPKNAPTITTFKNGADGLSYDQMITDTGTYASQCEHHMALFHGNYTFAYLPHPKGNILGLSKVARVVDFCSARLQVQERLTQDIVKMLWDALCEDTKYPPRGMALVMKGQHSCKSFRGVKKPGIMTTVELKGVFKKNLSVRTEFLRMVE